MNILRPLLLIVLGLALVVGFFRYEQSIEEQNRSPTGTIKEQPEFFLEQSLTTRYRQDGSIDYQFNSEHLDYFKNSDIAEASMAYFIFFNADGNTWHTRADKAYILNGNKKIHLSGNVKIWQPVRHLELTTDELFFSEEHDYAETDKPVTIKSPIGVTYSTGMNMDLKAEKLQLISKISGNYHARK